MTFTRQSFFLASAFTLLFAVAFAAVAFLFLPQMLLPRLAKRVMDETGLTFTAEASPRFDFDKGLGLTLRNIIIADPQGQSVPVLQAVSGEAAMGLFADELGEVILEDAVFSFNFASHLSQHKSPGITPFHLKLRNSAIKASGHGTGLNIVLSDVNGEVKVNAEGNLLIDARFLFNGQSTQVTASFDSLGRLRDEGSPSDIALTSGTHAVLVSGRARIAPELQLDGTLSATSTDLKSWLAWLGLSLSGFDQPQPLALEAGVSISPREISLLKAQVSLARMSGEGALKVAFAQTRPFLSGALTLSTLDLNTYLNPETPVPATEKPRSLADPWSERLLDFSDLEKLDVDVSIDSAAFRWGQFESGAGKTTALLRDGKLEAKLATSETFGGNIDAALTLEAQAQGAKLLFVSTLKTVDATKLLSALFNMPALVGTLSADISFSAQGQRETEFLASLAGTGKFNLSKAKLARLNAEALFGSDASEGWPPSPTSSELGTTEINLSILDGIVKIESGRVTIGDPATLSGQIDLLRQALDIVVARGTTSRGISGPWAKPGIVAR